MCTLNSPNWVVFLYHLSLSLTLFSSLIHLLLQFSITLFLLFILFENLPSPLSITCPFLPPYYSHLPLTWPLFPVLFISFLFVPFHCLNLPLLPIPDIGLFGSFSSNYPCPPFCFPSDLIHFWAQQKPSFHHWYCYFLWGPLELLSEA